MSIWDQIVAGIPTVILGALTIALGALIIWGGTRIVRLVQSGNPEFELRKRGENWEIERMQRAEAWAPAMHVDMGNVTGPVEQIQRAIGAGVPVGRDLKRGYPYQIGLENGHRYGMSWFDKRGRQMARSFVLEGDLVKVYLARKNPDGELIP